MIAAELGIGFTPSSDLPVTKAQGSEMILRLLGPPRRKVVMKDPPRLGVRCVLKHCVAQGHGLARCERNGRRATGGKAVVYLREFECTALKSEGVPA